MKQQFTMNIIIWLLASMIIFRALPAIGLSSRPKVVNIGAIFSIKSVIGKAAKVAMDAAIDDVNSHPDILQGTQLKLQLKDSNYSGFMALVEALVFMEKDTVAIIGPQSSVTAHVISHIANVVQVPLLSFSSTDPTLSPIQFPFFVRTSHNDLYQMSAIADIIDHYEWREVIAIYKDDDHGRNGIAALADELAERRCRITYRARLSQDPTLDEITDVLVKVALRESRILVVHVAGSWGLRVFSVAQYLGMLGSGYVWIATNWLSTVLDTDSPLSQDAMDSIQGVVTLRMYTPDSQLKRRFVSRWSNLTQGESVGLNAYSLYAYDTVWLLARAINEFFDQGGNISFLNDSLSPELGRGSLHFEALTVFQGGNLLLDNILNVNMKGVTGDFRFTNDRNLINPAFELINVIGTGYRRIGFWSNHSGLSIAPPETLWGKPPNRSSMSRMLHGVVWPGQTTQKPRGWVFPNSGRYLKFGVPNRVSYREFVSVKGPDAITGYCIDVFTAALNLLPYAVPYKLVPFGDGHTNPSGTELVRLITAGEFDAAIGDIAIINNRTKMADFTQPYIESGLVVVAPVWRKNSNAFAFLRPFTRRMWAVTAIFFLLLGTVVWILEHRMNDEFRGPPRRQVVTLLWFSFSTWFFAHRENTVSVLGRIVLIIWLFVVLIINSSYTASLTSILTVQQLTSPVKGIETLLASKDPIGYQQGSFARNYLTDELKIDPLRLVALNSPEECAKALKDGPHNGGVAAMVDERAYIELFLSTRCEFSIVGQEFTKNGWGFAFPRDSPLAVDMSNAILKLSENGDLKRIHDKWLLRRPCSYQGAKMEVDRLQLKSFWGLFLMCGLACLIALCMYFLKMVRQFSRHYSEGSEFRSSQSERIQTFLSFIDEKEEVIKNRSKRRQMERDSDRTDDGSNSTGYSVRRNAGEFASNKNIGTTAGSSEV